MLKACELHPARDVASMSFMAPPGIEVVRIDAETLLRATPPCRNTFEEAFIAGTAPIDATSSSVRQIAKTFSRFSDSTVLS